MDTYSLTYPLTRLLACLLTHSPYHSPTHPLTHSLTHSLTYLLTCCDRKRQPRHPEPRHPVWFGILEVPWGAQRGNSGSQADGRGGRIAGSGGGSQAHSRGGHASGRVGRTRVTGALLATAAAAQLDDAAELLPTAFDPRYLSPCWSRGSGANSHDRRGEGMNGSVLSCLPYVKLS